MPESRAADSTAEFKGYAARSPDGPSPWSIAPLPFNPASGNRVATELTLAPREQRHRPRLIDDSKQLRCFLKRLAARRNRRGFIRLNSPSDGDYARRLASFSPLHGRCKHATAFINELTFLFHPLIIYIPLQRQARQGGPHRRSYKYTGVNV